nr:unnamed protein product [Spirometra erinaceieuropaei]
MGLLGPTRVHESRTDHSLDTPNTCTSAMPSSTPLPSKPNTISSLTSSISGTSTMPSLTHTPSPSMSTINNSTTATITVADNDATDLSCPRTYIGLVGHLRIHCKETGEPVPETPTYTRRIPLLCSHCTRTF